MTEQNLQLRTLIVVRDVVGSVPYWATDESLPLVRRRFKRLSGKFPSSKASITAFTGDYDDLEKIAVNGLGDIQYPKTLTLAVIQ